MPKSPTKSKQLARLQSRVATLMQRVEKLRAEPLVVANGSASEALSKVHAQLDRAKFALFSDWADEIK